jgi:hypothetical protein
MVFASESSKTRQKGHGIKPSKRVEKAKKEFTKYLIKYKDAIAEQAIQQAGRLTVDAILAIAIPQVPALAGIPVVQRYFSLAPIVKEIFKIYV